MTLTLSGAAWHSARSWRRGAALYFSLAVTGGLLVTGSQAFAKGEVTQIHYTEKSSSPERYTQRGDEITWGAGITQVMTGFDYAGDTYGFIDSADRIELVRVDRPGQVTGETCGAFAERTLNPLLVQPGYPHDSSGVLECDMVALLNERVINRGALNVFSNIGPHPNNIERVDFLFDNGILAPAQEALLQQNGHIVSEKRGDNPIQIAAVLSLDSDGRPSAYGPLVSVNEIDCNADEICYGVTTLSHNYTFFSNLEEPDVAAASGRPFVIGESTESVAMAFISLDDLGLEAGTRYFGFSYFPIDVNPDIHDLLQPATFPGDTEDLTYPGDGADIYGGSAGYFGLGSDDGRGDDQGDTGGVGSSDSGTNPPDQIRVSVFIDSNGNQAKEQGEPGVEGIAILVAEDTNNNGQFDYGVDLQVGITDTDATGTSVFSGLPDGHYIVILDEFDSDLPPGIELLPGANPVLVQVPTDGNDVVFAFVDPSSRPSLDDHDVPVANPDTASGPQNAALNIDVLANDEDPAGGGLTITSIASVVSGTASIVGNQIEFVPEAGFVGTTSFIYTISDVDGREASGTVAVTMTRFSDINDNGLNDFDECNCTDIGLITGVNGGGLGSMGAVMLLLTGVYLRRRLTAVAGVQR